MYQLKNRNFKVEKTQTGYGVSENYNQILVFDCESDGLYGECFALGLVVLNIYPDNKVTIEKVLNLISKEGIKNISSNWVKENVLPNLYGLHEVETNKSLRDKFWEIYTECKEDNHFTGVYSDVNFPVETNFLKAVAMDDLDKREFNMPYPLYDISSIHKDTTTDRDDFYLKENAYYIVHDVATRRPKKHNPLWDCICSAYFLLNYKV